MELTPFAFLALAERTLVGLLPAAPGGAQWSFQRFVNFAGHSGSLEIGVQAGESPVRALGVLRARVVRGAHEAFLQGGMQPAGSEDSAGFVLKEVSGPRLEEEVFALAEGWAAVLAQGLQEPAPEAKPEKAPAAPKKEPRPKPARAKA
jgi:hypothetical protein